MQGVSLAAHQGMITIAVGAVVHVHIVLLLTVSCEWRERWAGCVVW